jgi:hypothetical protein
MSVTVIILQIYIGFTKENNSWIVKKQRSQ